MADARQRAEIFQPPDTVLHAGRRSRSDIDHSDPQLAALRGRSAGSGPTGFGIDVAPF